MIAPLRQRHRLMFIGLAAVLPALVAAAWLQRPAMPTSNLPGELLASTTGDELTSGDAGFTDHRAQLSRFESSIELVMQDPLRAPDVLAYLSTAGSAGDRLPSDARLLGAVHPSRANVYALDASASGELLLYSLGHQALIDRATLTALRGAAPTQPTTPADASGESPAAPEASTAAGETDGGAS